MTSSRSPSSSDHWLRRGAEEEGLGSKSSWLALSLLTFQLKLSNNIGQKRVFQRKNNQTRPDRTLGNKIFAALRARLVQGCEHLQVLRAGLAKER